MILERIHLAIVQAVEQHGSLTAAAERLCVTQSALSHSVRKLEERLGMQLFVRKTKPLRFTSAGLRLDRLQGHARLPQPGEACVTQLMAGRVE